MVRALAAIPFGAVVIKFGWLKWFALAKRWKVFLLNWLQQLIQEKLWRLVRLTCISWCWCCANLGITSGLRRLLWCSAEKKLIVAIFLWGLFGMCWCSDWSSRSGYTVVVHSKWLESQISNMVCVVLWMWKLEVQEINLHFWSYAVVAFGAEVGLVFSGTLVQQDIGPCDGN